MKGGFGIFKLRNSLEKSYSNPSAGKPQGTEVKNSDTFDV